MEEEAFHHYGGKVAFRSLKNGKYLAVDLKNACATATGNHPILYVQDLDFPKQEELRVLKFDNRESTEVMTFGTALWFQTEDGSYLTFNANGEMKVEKNPNYESGNNNIAKLAQWTILDSNDILNRGPVTQFDDIALRIPFGSYLMTEDSLLMSANGQAINEETSFKLVKANIPFLPDWLMKRPGVNHNNLVSRPFFDKHIPNQRKKVYEEKPKPIGTFPVEIQETLLLEDLLHAMNSVEGVYIRRINVENEYESSRYVYRVEPDEEQSTCDFSLLYLIGKILPMCNNHDRVLEFVSTHSHFEYGQVSQALCGAINILLKEYLVLVTQLDTEFVKGNLTLQKTWFYIQQSMRMMENLNKLAVDAADKRGGALLNVIYKFLTITSDKSIKELFSFLLEKAAEPFLKILMKWIYFGVLNDPFDEFLVEEDPSMNKDNIEKDFNDSYWQKRFTFREDMIPIFLGKLSIKILHTGKYLNVIREWGKEIKHPCEQEIKISINQSVLNKGNSQASLIQHKDFSEPIETAHSWSSQRLLDLFLVEERLMDRIKSIKHYFFLDLGDFFIHFFDSADKYLENNTKEVSNDKLKSLLEMAIRTSTANADPFKDDLTWELNNYSLIEQIFVMQNIRGAFGTNAYAADAGSGQRHNFPQVPISGMNSIQNYKCVDSFTLDYKVQWPLTLIISRRAITKYQLIFRHLFLCKYIERHLGNSWLMHQGTKELNLDTFLLASYNLRHRMHHFCKNYVYYIVVEVLEPNFHKFKQNMEKVKTVDEILELHNTFLDQCLKEWLLTDQNLLKIVIKIVNCCFFFSRIMHRQAATIQEEDSVLTAQNMVIDTNEGPSAYCKYRQTKINAERESAKKAITESGYKSMIEKFTKTFDTNLKQFMNAIKASHYDPYISNLLMRLDFNGFYAENLLSQFEGFGGNSFAPSESVNMSNNDNSMF